MENLISKGINTDSRSLGAFYILSALTLVSHSAAVALPWLYESVVQIKIFHAVIFRIFVSLMLTNIYILLKNLNKYD